MNDKKRGSWKFYILAILNNTCGKMQVKNGKNGQMSRQEAATLPAVPGAILILVNHRNHPAQGAFTHLRVDADPVIVGAVFNYLVIYIVVLGVQLLIGSELEFTLRRA